MNLTVSEKITVTGLAEFHPTLVYLFGSQATGNARATSDFDIAFLAPSPCDPLTVFDCSNHLALRLHRDVNLVDLDRASTVMRKEVIRTGRVIHGAGSRQRAAFEMRALSDYARLNEERAPVLASS